MFTYANRNTRYTDLSQPHSSVIKVPWSNSQSFIFLFQEANELSPGWSYVITKKEKGHQNIGHLKKTQDMTKKVKQHSNIAFMWLI